MSTPARLFAEAGAALFGEDWGPGMAEALGMNLRTCQRIKAAVKAGGDYPVAPGALADLVVKLIARQNQLGEIRRRLEALLPPPRAG
jgi:hypothetical protein